MSLYHILFSLWELAFVSSLVLAWLPMSDKPVRAKNGDDLFKISNGALRGVNVGSLFVMEPWMIPNTWTKMGCGKQKAEMDCVEKLGQKTANKRFAKHWDEWIDGDDIDDMVELGLNTVRIPVGFWIYEKLIEQNGRGKFPRGCFDYVRRLCGKAADAGMYVIIDLHAAPGGQTSSPNVGEFVEEPLFYTKEKFDIALQWMAWMTNAIHTTKEFRTVGMLEILNEPEQSQASTGDMINYFYPNALKKIRHVEKSLGTNSSDALHIQMMNQQWGSGNPTDNIHGDDTFFLAYDSHIYPRYTQGLKQTTKAYLQQSCQQRLDTEGAWPIIVGEFSLSGSMNADDWEEWDPTNKQFYREWFAAQLSAYERTAQGWCFWSWKTETEDYRWSYQDAIKAAIIPKNLTNVWEIDGCSRSK